MKFSGHYVMETLGFGPVRWQAERSLKQGIL
jgi:hypothetical protein